MNTISTASTPVSEAVQARLEKIQEAGIRLDEHQLVIPDWNRTVRSRLAPTLNDIRGRIIESLRQGQHVLYVPGSYDLVHAGHASYILEGIETYLKQEGITRDQLYVVALADDDELIRAVKPPHFKAMSRNQASVGDEHPRPIECDELFRFVTGSRSPRLIDLASLPVDLVGHLPSPSHFEKTLHDPLFTSWLKRARCIAHMNGSRPESEDQKKLDMILQRIETGRFAEILEDFSKTKYNLFAPHEQRRWDVGSWQFLLHLYIGDVHQSADTRPYVRMISEHDVQYKDVVAESMRLCGINPHFVNDTPVVSTTALLAKHGWENLYRAKQAHFRDLDIAP